MEAFQLKDLIKNRTLRIVTIVVLVMLVLYLILKTTGWYNEFFLPTLDAVYKTYLIIPEWIANQIFRITDAPVFIIDHQFIYESQSAFHEGYERFIANWPRYFLHKNWCIIILGLIWVNTLSLRKKLIATLNFIFIHILVVVVDIYFMGVVYPRIFQDEISVHLSPTLAANLIFYCFAAGWILKNIDEIRKGISKLGTKFQPSIRQLRELVILLFFFLVLREFLIPYFQYKPYVAFLLGITEHIGSWFGYPGYIIGDQLRGEYGTLGLSKHCLGFMSFYLFASFVFLIRDDIPNKVTFIYISIGLVFLSILNIIRLSAVYIIVQGVNGTERAALHHEIYNVVIYIAIFGLWILWYERFVRRAKKEK